MNTAAGDNRIAVTKLRAQRKLPGTDLFCQYYAVVNMPGVTAIWIGRMVPPRQEGVAPEFETIEQAWLYRGEEYYSLDDLNAALIVEEHARKFRDRLGETIHRLVRGLERPLWADMRDEAREPWRAKGDCIEDLFTHFGLSIMLMDGANGR